MNNEQKARLIVKRELPHFKWLSFFSFLFSTCLKLIGLIPGILMSQIVDKWIPTHNIKNCMIFIILFAIIPILTTVGNSFYKYVVIVNGRYMSRRLSSFGFEKQVYQPLTYFDQHKSAELASYCRSEATKYVLFWIMDIPQLFSSILAGIVVLIYIASLNIGYGMSLLLYIPILLFPSKFFTNRVENYTKKIIHNNSMLNQIISDTFRAIKNVKSMCVEKIMVKKVYDISSDTAEVFAKTAAVENLHGTWINSFVDSLFTGVMFACGAILIIQGKLTLGSLIVVMNYMPKVFGAVKAVARTNMNFKKQLGEYDKFFEMLVMEDERQSDKGDKAFSWENELVFRNVTFAYTEERGNVLQNMNFSIIRGEWIGVMGNSGAGKSTIFDLLLKLYTAYDGDILIDDINLKEISAMELRKNITRVSQDVFLFPGTLRDNLLLANPNASESELYEVLGEVELRDFVAKLPQGIDTDMGENGILMSGGERQRICLAQGLLRNSRVLLLDEVTANIDTKSEREICKTIQKLKDKNDLTVISISHRVDFLENTNQIFIVDNGYIAKTVTYLDLKNHVK